MPVVYKKDYFETFGEKYDNISLRDFAYIHSNQHAIKPEGVLLDLACGSGAMGERYVKRLPGLHAIGVDLSWALLRWANLPTCQADVSYLPFKKASLDHIMAAAAFHHFPMVDRVIKECARCLKAGGSLTAYDPNILHPQRLLMMTKPLRLFFYKIGDRAMSPLRFKALLSENGFKQVKVSYFAFEGIKTSRFGRINYKLTKTLDRLGWQWLLPFVSPWYLVSAKKIT